MRKLTEAQWARITELTKEFEAMEPSQRWSAFKARVKEKGRESPVLPYVMARLLSRTESVMSSVDGESMPGESDRRTTSIVDRSGMVCGPYLLGEPIGQGFMGSVYAGRLAGAAGGEYNLAVKVMQADQFEDPELMKLLFMEEYALHASLNWKNIPPVYPGDLCEDIEDGKLLHCFAIKYVRGIPIDQFVAEQRLLPSEVLELFLLVCAAMDKAHRALVLHCDLKPGHILVETDPEDGSLEPYIIDFGMALINDPVIKLQNKGYTRQYASPEQLDETRYGRPTPATDVYTLGIILYELLAGRHPFDAALDRPPDELRYIMLHYPPEPLGTFCELCTEDLQQVVHKALALDPDRRYRGVDGFMSAIRLCIDGVKARESAAMEREQMNQEQPVVSTRNMSGEDRKFVSAMLRDQDFWRLPSDRWEFVDDAFLGHEKGKTLIDGFKIDGDRRTAADNFVRRCAQFGPVSPKKHALGVAIHALRDRVSTDDEAELQKLLDRYGI